MSAHESPTSAHTSVIHEGRKFSITDQPGRGWRLRSRSKYSPIDILLGTGSEAWARKAAAAALKGSTFKQKAKRSAVTVHDLVEAYKIMPKRAGADAQTTSLSRLATVIRTTLGREIAAVKVEEICPAFWLSYCAKKQKRAVADLSTRRSENATISSRSFWRAS